NDVNEIVIPRQISFRIPIRITIDLSNRSISLSGLPRLICFPRIVFALKTVTTSLVPIDLIVIDHPRECLAHGSTGFLHLVCYLCRCHAPAFFLEQVDNLSALLALPYFVGIAQQFPRELLFIESESFFGFFDVSACNKQLCVTAAARSLQHQHCVRKGRRFRRSADRVESIGCICFAGLMNYQQAEIVPLCYLSQSR